MQLPDPDRDDEAQPFLNNANRQQPRIAQLGGAEPIKLARDESFCDTIHLNICPELTFCSFTTIIILVDIGLYVATLVLGKMSNTDFLAPNSEMLDKFGWKDARKIKVDH